MFKNKVSVFLSVCRACPFMLCLYESFQELNPDPVKRLYAKIPRLSKFVDLVCSYYVHLLVFEMKSRSCEC